MLFKSNQFTGFLVPPLCMKLLSILADAKGTKHGLCRYGFETMGTAHSQDNLNNILIEIGEDFFVLVFGKNASRILLSGDKKECFRTNRPVYNF